MEIWKDVKGFEGLYSVSDKGRVKSHDKKHKHFKNGAEYVRKGRILRPYKKKHGYLEVSLYDINRKPHYKLVHRIVAEAFLPKVNGAEVVNHKDHSKVNNKVENLEWCTQKENCGYSLKKGFYKVGEEAHSAKMTRETVIECRKKYFVSGFSIKDLSNEYGLSYQNMNSLIKGESWRCVEDFLVSEKKYYKGKLYEMDFISIKEMKKWGCSTEYICSLYNMSKYTLFKTIKKYEEGVIKCLK